MKYIAVIIALLCAHVSTRSQDTLLLNDGSEKIVKVIEISDDGLSYKNIANPEGPLYHMKSADVFIIIYKGGKRESFSSAAESSRATTEKQTGNSLSDNTYRVILLSAQPVPDKKNKLISVAAEAEVYIGDKFFTKLSMNASQPKEFNGDYARPGGGYYANSFIHIIPEDKISQFLYNKYENYAGKGYGWALPPNFFSTSVSVDCTVAFLEQKDANKETIGFGGISFSKISLQNCSTIEIKLLSIALGWMHKNFDKEHN